MIVATTPDEARPSRREYSLSNGTKYWKTDYFGGKGWDPAHPQAFFVEQAPGSVVRPHFHDTDQFQVVVGGDGVLGKHAIGPVTVHYTAAYTGYGPIAAGSGGLDYFTLRNRFAPRPYFYPESRHENKPARRRQLVAGPVDCGPAGRSGSDGPGGPGNSGPATLTALFDGEENGVGAWLLRLDAGDEAAGPATGAGGGQYHLVIDGALLHGGKSLPRRSCVFVDSDEPPPAFAAGPEGLHLLILQLPTVERE